MSREAENNKRQSHTGIVYKKVISEYTLRSNGAVYRCSISNKLRKQLVYPVAAPSSLSHRVMEVKQIQEVDPVAIGDEVIFTPVGVGDPGRLEGMIIQVLPRKNKLIRKAAGKKLLEQVIVANVDQVLIVLSITQPEPKWNLVDRYLVSAESAGIPGVLCVTKMDLYEDRPIPDELLEIQHLGYPVVYTSSATGSGLPAFQEVLADKTSVLVGKSGVGKTSLLNALEGGLGFKVGAVGRESGKGRHTTSSLEMIDLRLGGRLVDTPGMREFGLWQLDSELARYFPEMRPYVGKCRYGASCLHIHESGCGIRQAVSAGSISVRRYQSFLKLRDE